MKRCPTGHATHPQWRMAAALALAQLRGYMALPAYADTPNLGLLYITDHYAAEAQAILDFFAAELPTVTDWSGTVGIGVCASGAEYFDEPALSVMLLELPTDQYRIFSGVTPLPRTGQPGFSAHTALLHAEGRTPDLPSLIAEVAQRTSSAGVFGGLAASRGASVQFAVSSTGTVAGQGGVSGVFSGGLSGVAWGAGLHWVSRLTQGCQPVGPRYHITAAQDNVVLELDGQPALDVLLHTLGVSLQADPHQAVERVRGVLAGLIDIPEAYHAAPVVQHPGTLGADVRVRHIIGLDGSRRGVALADEVAVGMGLHFCQRHHLAARADLVRICAELREELAPDALELLPAVGGADAALLPQQMVGAIYISCSGRGGNHFGAPGAELQWLRHALGDVPLVGFFAGGEIVGQQLYGYSAVLTVLLAPQG
jgi:small ligand-binding sensory domain FIST